MELGLQSQEPFPLLGGELRDRDPGRPRHDVRDVVGGYLRGPLPAFAALVELAAPRVDLVLQLARAVVVLGRGRLVALAREAAQVFLERPRVGVLRLRAQADAGARLVDEVDRLVRKEPIPDVAVRELGGGDDRLVGDPDAVERLVAVLQAVQDLDRLVHRRLADEHRLEAPLERGVALDVLAVLVERRRADDVHLASGERRLEHVAGVHRALGRAGPDERVQLVDEEDDLALVLGDLVDHVLQPLLELAAVLGAGDHPGEVELDDAPSGQRLRDLVVDDALRDPLDDRGLAHARIADQRGIVLRPPREDLDRLLDLVRPSDHRVELALAGHLGEVAAVLVERRRRARLPRAASGLDSADHGAAKLRVRDAEPLQELPGLALLVAGEREQDVLGPDVRGAELARLVVGGKERRLRVRRERGGHVGALAFVGLLLELGRDRLGVGVDLPQHVPDDVVGERGVQEVVGVEVQAAPLERGLGRALEELPGGVAEELGDVDALNLPRRLGERAACGPLAEEVREEVVEEAAATAEVVRHPLLGKVDLAQVLDLLRAVRTQSRPRRDRRPSVPLASLLDGHGSSSSSLGYVFTSIRRRCAFCDLGTRTVRTPSFRLASMLSPSTWSGSVTRYSYRPVRRVRRRRTPWRSRSTISPLIVSSLPTCSISTSSRFTPGSSASRT